MKFGMIALAALLLAASCKPKAGGSCKTEGKELCVDEKKALACHDSKWEEMSCKGGSGCSKATGESVCDQSVAEDKELCNLEGDFVCSGDKRGMLQCTKGHWSMVQSCLGDRSCVMEKRKVTCDNSVANPNDACREEQDYACAPDKKTALACRGGKFVQASLCKGPKGCRIAGSKDEGYKVECDDSVAVAGDACEKEDRFSCSADEKAILKCRSKRFETEEKCKGKDRCQIKGGTVGCF